MGDRAPGPPSVRARVIVIATLIVALQLASGLTAQPVAAAADPVIAAAGDIACDPASASFHAGQGSGSTCRQLAVSNLLVAGHFSAVLALGDTQYECGGLAAFQQSYNLSWGRVKSITHPVVGNHEYLTSGGTDCSPTANAAGYFQYFGAAIALPLTGRLLDKFGWGAWYPTMVVFGAIGVGAMLLVMRKQKLLARPSAP